MSFSHNNLDIPVPLPESLRSKFEKVPRGIPGEKSKRYDMFGKSGLKTRCPEGYAFPEYERRLLCHVYGPFEFRTSLGTSILLLRRCMHHINSDLNKLTLWTICALRVLNPHQ